MKKIAFVIGSPTPDHAPLFQEISRTCPEIDLTVCFCSDFGVKKPGYDANFGQEIKWDVPLLDGYKSKFLKNLSFKSSIDGFWGLINPGIILELWQNDYDAVLIDGYSSLANWFSFLGAWLSGTAIIFRGESDLSNKRPFLLKIFKKIILTPLFKSVRAFLYSCQRNKDYFLHYGVSAEKLFFFPSAADNSYWQKKISEIKGRELEMKKNLGISIDSQVVLYVGNLAPLKRPMDLLSAFEAVTNAGLDAFLVFVGEGRELPKMKDYAEKKRINNIVFAGFRNQSELPYFYAIADVMVLASEWDRSPKVFNEAMNFGIPLIATDTIGTAFDLFSDGRAGLIYPMGDVPALVSCLKKILGDRELAAKMQKASFELSLRWSFQGDIDGLAKAIESLK
ncbi:MAG: glycosyltransferase family 4 protein [bacterium]|nr:glycosyltransferase family 4 protein [bacterium]